MIAPLGDLGFFKLTFPSGRNKKSPPVAEIVRKCFTYIVYYKSIFTHKLCKTKGIEKKITTEKDIKK